MNRSRVFAQTMSQHEVSAGSMMMSRGIRLVPASSSPPKKSSRSYYSVFCYNKIKIINIFIIIILK